MGKRKITCNNASCKHHISGGGCDTCIMLDGSGKCKGMHGMNVHTAVIKAKESETGVTIHRVNAEYDSGEIVAQTTVPVLKNDTPEILAARVLDREHEFWVEVIADIVNGEITLG